MKVGQDNAHGFLYLVKEPLALAPVVADVWGYYLSSCEREGLTQSAEQSLVVQVLKAEHRSLRC